MRAIIFDEPGDESVLYTGEVEAPTMGPKDIRIRTRATSVNRADLLQRQGMYPSPPGASPLIGLECAGEIMEIGNEVTGWKPGDRVMAILPGGGYGEQVVCDAGSALPVPDIYSDEEAGSTCEVFLTAFLNIFMLGDIPEGGRVLVHGGGSGVGTATISLGKEAGLTTLVTAGSEEKCQRCLDHGADVAINYRDGDFAEKVLEATGGKGVHVVLDCIGGRYLEQNCKCLTPDGALVIIGLQGGSKGEINLARMLTKRLSVIGSTMRARSAEKKAVMVKAFLDRFGDALKSGRIRPVIQEVFPIDKVGEGHRAMKEGKHFGKLALKAWE
uniref:Putative NAD(P)H quinone oxidoreductase, PIG3 family n=1 Tax=Candidatus Kentrum sp. FM TaxID=2126340 RepID=A0A450X0P2_9GAMM|nr:MAG: putative NAD(P)H quinone oxidoreductase, PIG3 family [Candidatus Kentron sp. FM]VFJ76355.1 MAG: putative NAD(P)H quinone oxidoreductase, PIG3 family [Candidatus Kentron sp. FM]VFK22874.1 MAG: putative NAD(P)H quinone oxidoreductase, PIG3 family [Candidatus Kentron sp. FM]